MGNTESQNVNISGKGKANSLILHKSKELSLSPHSWWKISEETSGPKAKHSFLSHNSSQHCIPQHYDSNKCRSGDESHCKFDIPLFQGNGFFLGYRDTEGNCSFQTNMKRPSSELIENKISPKVVFREDGSLRVEFSNAKRESNAEVPLIGCSKGSVDSTQRASNGSSISSEGSWYDSPWGNATDICDHDFITGQPSENSSGYTTLSSTRTVDLGCFKSCAIEQTERQIYSQTKAHTSQDTRADSNIDCNYTYQGEEDSGIGDSLLLRLERSDLSENYRKAQNPAPFPTADILTMNQLQDTSQLQSSITNSQDQSQELQNFAFHTLPHRKVPENTRTKDSLKKRIWRLSDWTGSISRKKRRVQEPSTSEVSEVFTCGDGGTSEEFRPFWNPLSSQKPFHNVLPLTGQVSQQHEDSAFKQNIYKNFKQELETGSSTGTVDGIQFWEGEDEHGESINGSVRSLEQIDFLFEKEQGVVRRAGWLSFKPLITLHKDRKLELVARCKWKQYWVTLKGCTLLLGESNIKTFPEQEFTPRYAVLAEDSVVQAVPEHPKRENVFCLSNSFGDVYLFQATNQTDLENWVTAIHSASASHLSKRHRKKDSLCLIRSQTRSLLQKIDMDGKMKKMAELQLSVISDQKNRKAVENQILQWEQNLEKFNLELFRMRCYLASLQGTELPNPKSLLATVGRQSKMVLNRLGIFSVSSFHALICTRDEATLKRRSRSNPRRMKTKHGLLFSSQKGLDSLPRPNHKKRQSLSQLFEGNSSASVGQPSTLSSSERLEMLAKLHSTAPPEGHLWECNVETLHVLMPDGQVVSVPVRQDSLVADVISVACKIKELDPFLHCLLVKSHFGEDGNRSYPAPKELIRTMVFDELEVLPFKVFTLNMSRPDPSVDFGFAVTGHVDSARKSCIYISEVNPFGLAYAEGLRAGDEILTLNGVSVASLDLGLMQSFFCHQELRLLLRRENNNSDWPDYDLSATLDPPPPPPQADHMELENTDPLCEKFSQHSVVRAVEEENNKTKHDNKKLETMCNLQQMFPEGHRNHYSSENGVVRSSPRHMSVTERLCMVIQELVDTEKSYVKDLSSLFEIYLNPLQKQTFLSNDEMESLFGSLPKMLDFQRVFLQTLEDRITSSMDYQMLKNPEKVKNILFSLGGSFLYYADHFKLYSGFCANHIKVQKVLERAKTDRAFREFLEARNPTKQHSSTLESYLIKPVQRVLKYPLLLRELVSLTDPHSDEHNHLTEALKAMEKVATHINEMQKIYEDYGTVFDQLVSEQSGPEKEISEISMGEFIIHSSALWLNPLPSLGRTRKEPDLTLFLFKRALILVYRESKLKKRMSSARLGEADPFKFRWLIPISSLQVLPGNLAGSENPCVWEVVHTKSEVQGRPEMQFQLCSSTLESKASAVRAICSLLRENSKRTVAVERRIKDLNSNFTFPRRSHPGAIRSNSWLRLPPHFDGTNTSYKHQNIDKDSHSEPPYPNTLHRCLREQNSLVSNSTTLCSLTSDLESQIQRLKIASSLQSSQVTLLDEALDLDLNNLMGREYSVPSLSSVVNEDCFYDCDPVP